MSFRGRLSLFLLLIVVVPMVAIALLATRVADDASSGKADARLFAGLETATALFEERSQQAAGAAEAIGADPALAEALRAEDEVQAQAVAERLARERGVEALVLRSAGGEELAKAGTEAPFAAATIRLEGADGSEAGTLSASATTREEYLRELQRLTGRDAILYVQGQPSVTLPGGGELDVPADGGADAVVDGEEQRVLTGALPDGEGTRVALLGPPEEGGFFSSSPLVAAALAAFFAIALLFALGVMGALSGQVKAMLEAARRIGSGDFSRKLPVSGRDEMAGLADEFNKMSDRLAEQIDQLRHQQVEIDRSIRRIGEAFASGLDREGLLEIVAETAVSACDAEYGLIALSGREGAEVSAGQPGEGVEDAVLTAEAEASRGNDLAEHSSNGAHALSAPLRRIGDPGHNLGVMTVARSGEAFTQAESDVFVYLIGQASASIENVALHEMVSEQAVTDELTGLANNRAFADVAGKEAARAERFAHPLSLLMLDIDDFKRVNDTYGHLQGDEVLRRIGRILRSESRGIDEPARYGGEEFVVALPETGPEGALELAERVRSRIAAEEIPFLAHEGILRITASLGVASIPDSAVDVESLIAAADAALYAAKRGGKDRVEVAPARNQPSTRSPARKSPTGKEEPAEGRAASRR